MLTDEELLQKVQTFLDEQESADQFSGAVLVAHNNLPILTTARGYAIRPQILRNQSDTKFNIASVTKMFTAMQLRVVRLNIAFRQCRIFFFSFKHSKISGF